MRVGVAVKLLIGWAKGKVESIELRRASCVKNIVRSITGFANHVDSHVSNRPKPDVHVDYLLLSIAVGLDYHRIGVS